MSNQSGNDLLVKSIHKKEIQSLSHTPYTPDQLKTQLHTELAGYNLTQNIIDSLDQYIDAQIQSAQVLDKTEKEGRLHKIGRLASGLAIAGVGPGTGALVRAAGVPLVAANPLAAAALGGLAGGISAAARNIIELKLASRRGAEGLTKYYATKVDIDRKFKTEESQKRNIFRRAYAGYANFGKNETLDVVFHLDRREGELENKFTNWGIDVDEKWAILNPDQVVGLLDAKQPGELLNFMTEMSVIQKFYIAMLSRGDFSRYGKSEIILQTIETLSNLILISGGIVRQKDPSIDPFKAAGSASDGEIENMASNLNVVASSGIAFLAQGAKSMAAGLAGYGIAGAVKNVTKFFPGRGPVVVAGNVNVPNPAASQAVLDQRNALNVDAQKIIDLNHQMSQVESGAGGVVTNVIRNNFDPNQVIPNDPLIGLARYAAKVTHQSFTDQQLGVMSHSQLEDIIRPYAQMAGARMENFEVLNLLARNPDLRSQFTTAANSWLAAHPGSGLTADDVILGMRGRLESFFDENNPVNPTTLAKYFNTDAGTISVASMKQGLNVMTVGGSNGGVNENWANALKGILRMPSQTQTITNVAGAIDVNLDTDLRNQVLAVIADMERISREMSSPQGLQQFADHLNNLQVAGALSPNFDIPQFLSDIANQLVAPDSAVRFLMAYGLNVGGNIDNVMDKTRKVTTTRPLNAPPILQNGIPVVPPVQRNATQNLLNIPNMGLTNASGTIQLNNIAAQNNQPNQPNIRLVQQINTVLGTNMDMTDVIQFLSNAQFVTPNTNLLSQRFNGVRITSSTYNLPDDIDSFNINGKDINVRRLLILTPDDKEVLQDLNVWNVGGIQIIEDGGRFYRLEKNGDVSEIKDNVINLQGVRVSLSLDTNNALTLENAVEFDPDIIKIFDGYDLTNDEAMKLFNDKLELDDFKHTVTADTFLLDLQFPVNSKEEQTNEFTYQRRFIIRKDSSGKFSKVPTERYFSVRPTIATNIENFDRDILIIGSNAYQVKEGGQCFKIELNKPFKYQEGRKDVYILVNFENEKLTIRKFNNYKEALFEDDFDEVNVDGESLTISSSKLVESKPLKKSKVQTFVVLDENGNPIEDSYSIKAGDKRVLRKGDNLFVIEGNLAKPADQNQVDIEIDGKKSKLKLEAGKLEIFEQDERTLTLPTFNREALQETRVTVSRTSERLSILESQLSGKKVVVESRSDNAITFPEFPDFNSDEKALLLGRESLWYDKLVEFNPDILNEDYDRNFDFGYENNGVNITSALASSGFDISEGNQINIVQFINNPDLFDIDKVEQKLRAGGWKDDSISLEKLKKQNKEAITKYLFHLIEAIEIELGGKLAVFNSLTNLQSKDISINIEDRNDDQAIQFIGNDNLNKLSPDEKNFIGGRVSTLFDVAQELNPNIDIARPETLNYDFSKDGRRFLKAIIEITGPKDGESISLFRLLNEIENIDLGNLYPELLENGWNDNFTGNNRAALGLMIWHLANAIDGQIGGVEEAVPAPKDELVVKGQGELVRLIASVKQEDVKPNVAERIKNDTGAIETAVFTMIGYHGDRGNDLVTAVILGRVQDENLQQFVAEIVDQLDLASEDRASAEIGIYEFIQERVLTDDVHIVDSRGQAINTSSEKLVDTLSIDPEDIDRVSQLIEDVQMDPSAEVEEPSKEVEEEITREFSEIKIGEVVKLDLDFGDTPDYQREFPVVDGEKQVGTVTLEFIPGTGIGDSFVIMFREDENDIPQISRFEAEDESFSWLESDNFSVRLVLDEKDSDGNRLEELEFTLEVARKEETESSEPVENQSTITRRRRVFDALENAGDAIEDDDNQAENGMAELLRKRKEASEAINANVLQAQQEINEQAAQDFALDATPTTEPKIRQSLENTELQPIETPEGVQELLRRLRQSNSTDTFESLIGQIADLDLRPELAQQLLMSLLREFEDTNSRIRVFSGARIDEKRSPRQFVLGFADKSNMVLLIERLLDQMNVPVTNREWYLHNFIDGIENNKRAERTIMFNSEEGWKSWLALLQDILAQYPYDDGNELINIQAKHFFNGFTNPRDNNEFFGALRQVDNWELRARFLEIFGDKGLRWINESELLVNSENKAERTTLEGLIKQLQENQKKVLG